MNHNAARLTLDNFVNEWAAPSLRDAMRQDLIDLITSAGGEVLTDATPPTCECEYCARGIPRELHQRMDRGFKTWSHYDLGDWVECTA